MARFPSLSVAAEVFLAHRGMARPDGPWPRRRRRVPPCEGMDKRLRLMADLAAPLKVAPGREVRLHRDFDPGYTGSVERAQAGELLTQAVQLLADYQDRLPAHAPTRPP